MKNFIAIDFETANPQRVSACAMGYAIVSDCNIVETKGYLIKPIGGHAPFQSKIHGIKEEHTFDKPVFGALFPEIKDIFNYPLVAHSLFDKQVLNALSDYFDLKLNFNYIDSCSLAKEKLPNLKNCKLPTLVKHFDLPAYKHHDAKEDASACAKVFLKLQDFSIEKTTPISTNELFEFKGMLMGILADDQINYKETLELLYWLEDHAMTGKQQENLCFKIKEILDDNHLDHIESNEIKIILEQIINELK